MGAVPERGGLVLSLSRCQKFTGAGYALSVKIPESLPVWVPLVSLGRKKACAGGDGDGGAGAFRTG